MCFPVWHPCWWHFLLQDMVDLLRGCLIPFCKSSLISSQLSRGRCWVWEEPSSCKILGHFVQGKALSCSRDAGTVLLLLLSLPKEMAATALLIHRLGVWELHGGGRKAGRDYNPQGTREQSTGATAIYQERLIKSSEWSQDACCLKPKKWCFTISQ